MIPPQFKNFNFVLIDPEGDGKKPMGLAWQKKIIRHNHPDLLKHLESGNNYGIQMNDSSIVIDGHSYFLIVVDFDKKEFQDKILPLLPETFTTSSGSTKNCVHLWFASDNNKAYKIKDEKLETLADVIGAGNQVIAPGSKHKSGSIYSIIKDIPFAFIPYSELEAILKPHDKSPKKITKPKKEYKAKGLDDGLSSKIINAVPLIKILEEIGIDTSKNPTNCFFHSSVGGKCLGFNENTCHCFHCEGSWNAYSLIKEAKKMTDKETFEWFAERAGLLDELIKSRKEYRKKQDSEEKTYERKSPINSSVSSQEIKSEYLDLIKDKKWGDASELLVDYIKSKLHIYTTKDDIKSEVWIYRDGIYVPQGKSEIKEFLRNLLGKFYSTFAYNLTISKIEPDTYIDQDKFFKTQYKNKVAVQNGILDIKTLELIEFTPDKIFFNKMPVTFDTSKECPRIDKFLREVLSHEDDIRIFYELCGFGLLDEYKFEKAFMFHGEGRNGKGKTIELIKRLFGIENCCSIQLSALNSENFSVGELFGKRLNLAGDIGHQDLKETNMFKSLTGRDLVTAKRKYLRDLHFQNYAKFVFACNELPMVYDLTKGFWDRWILLDFPYTFVTQEEYDSAIDKTKLKIKDDEIVEKISYPDEMSGLLNQALLALNRLEQNKKFSTTCGSEEVKTTWIRRSNSFIAFCWDVIEDDYEGRISKKDLRKRYSQYCREHKIQPKSDFVIKKVLQENYGATEIRGESTRNDIYSFVRNDYWEGIKWK